MMRISVLSQKNLLILDDHALFSEVLKQVLDDKFKVTTTNTSKDLFDQLKQMEFDLLLLDLTLPQENGLDIYSKLRSSGFSMPVLLVTASNNSSRLRDARELGIDGYFHKAENLNSLREAINVILGGGEWWPEANGSLNTDALLKKHGLTARQFNVLQLIDKGYTNSDIAAELYVSESTVKSHVTALFTQLAVKNRTSCLRSARLLGLLT